MRERGLAAAGGGGEGGKDLEPVVVAGEVAMARWRSLRGAGLRGLWVACVTVDKRESCQLPQ